MTRTFLILTRTFQILTAAAAGMAILLALVPQTGHDQLWLLLAGARMGPHGKPYGPEVLESNPPLAIWLSAAVVGVGRLLHLPVTFVFKTLIVLLVGVSGAVCFRLLRTMQLAEPNRFPAATQANGWILTFVWTMIFGVLPARDFGQRDHVLALLIVPYLIAAARPLVPDSGRWPVLTRLGVSAAAALGVALKPHHVVIPVAVELLLLVRSRRLRVLEPAVFLAVGVAYLSAIQVLAPTFLTEVLPLVRDTYWAFGQLTPVQLAAAATELNVLALVTIVLFLSREAINPLPTVLITAGLAALLRLSPAGHRMVLPATARAESVQRRGSACLCWSASRGGLAGWCLTGWCLRRAGLGFTALVLTAVFSDFHLVQGSLEQPQQDPDSSFFTGLAPGTPVATLTTSVDDSVPPAFRYRLTLAQRYPHLWLLPAIMRNQSGPPLSKRHRLDPIRLAELEGLQHRMMVEDLERWRPRADPGRALPGLCRALPGARRAA